MFQLKSCLLGLERWLHSYKYWLLFYKTQVQFPLPTAHNHSRRSDALLWPPLVLHVQGSQTYKGKIINTDNFFNYMLKSQTCIGTHCHKDQIQNHSRDPCLFAVICLKGFLFKKRYSIYLCMWAHKYAMTCMWWSEDNTF